jgi:hypothetical protein
VGGEYIDGCQQISLGSAHRCECSSVARSFKLVQIGPVIRKIRRFEELNAHRVCVTVENDARVSSLGAPSLLKPLTAHCSLCPSTRQAAQLVMVGAARGQGALYGETAHGPT